MNRKLVAILRGVEPEEVEAVGAALIDAGISMIEVPLNSPRPFDSIEILVKSLAREVVIGAGTVLTVEQVNEVARTGARLIVSPNTNAAVIERTLEQGMLSMPGALTPTECVSAVAAGTRSIKLFPASQAGPGGLTAIKAVLPRDIELFPVGGVDEPNFRNWIDAGAAGFGIGSALYRPGQDASEVGARARSIVDAYDRAVGGSMM